MKTQRIAVLDRLVRIDRHAGMSWPTLGRISDLRSFPYLVILGEPGIGKSTVLEQEAASENAIACKVRDVVTGTKLEPGAPLFVDALDEYRIDGSSVDKAHGLAQAMNKAKPSRWRLTCRAEDWNKSADLAAIRNSAGGQEIIIAQLLPLTGDEALRVLESLDEPDPARFVAKAHALGAQSLLESPLSLKLLQAAVSHGGNWPTSRFELFASAIQRLASEHNPIHRGGSRQPLPQIIEAAEKTCLVMLLSGRRTLWRSHDDPPVGGDDRAYLRGYELDLDDQLFRDVLDTSLFRGEGESFEPIHRTVAEYLAGRALAKAVAGSSRNAGFPLGRAIAIVTGIDRKAPTEMRGLYAWFAAHLAKLGNADEARQLIEADAATVLAYGDTAVFSTALRRIIFTNLDRDDPYFRSDDHKHDTAVGGLAGPDLADDFAAELDKPTASSHRLITVFEALSNGTPVESLRPRLWSIALDATRPEWQRLRAAQAWLNGAQARARELYDAVCATTATSAREALRIQLAEELPPQSLSTDDIKSLIADFAARQGGYSVGRLISLARSLSSTPRGELFNVDLNTWLPKKDWQSSSVDLDAFFDSMLATAIRLTPDLTATRLWSWVNNVRDGRWESLRDESRNAIQTWLNTDPSRESALLDVIIDDEDAKGAPHMPANNFITLTGRLIVPTLVRHILATVAEAPVSEESKSQLSVAVDMAGRLKEEAITQEALALTSSRPDCADLVAKLVGPPADASTKQKQINAQTARRVKDAAQKATNIAILTPDLADIRSGVKTKPLGWASRLYFEEGDGDRPVGLDKVVYFSDEVITEAITTGWNHLVMHGSTSITPKSLGQSERRYATDTEAAFFAGLDRLFQRDIQPGPTTSTLVVAVAVLKGAWFLKDSKKRKLFEHWAFTRLNAEPVAGAAHLQEYWTEAIDVGSDHIDSLMRVSDDNAHGPAVIEALYAVMDSRRSMLPSLLRTAWRAAVKHIEPRRLLALAEVATVDATVTREQRHIWTFMAFALDPRTHGTALLAEHGADGGSPLFEEFRGLQFEPIGTIDMSARAEREGLIIRMVGPKNPPIDQSGEEGLASTSGDIMRRAIQLIAAYPDMEAGEVIKNLVASPALAAWKTHLQHAYAQWARLYRESTYRYPSPKAILSMLSGGAPVNAADLMAVVIEELLRLRRELRTSSSTPWKSYWNTDRYGKVDEPRIENECRDRLLERLLDRLERYKISDGFGEARRPEGTRADMLFLNGAGKSIPVEVKRHFHDKIWVASMDQLHGYAQAEGSDGYGVYLVFWFGLDEGALPRRKDGAELPTSAAALEEMLVIDLPTPDRERIQVIVFDVSKEAAE